MCELLKQELVKYFAHSALTSQFITRAMGHLGEIKKKYTTTTIYHIIWDIVYD